MKKVLKLFVVFSMCLSQLFFAALYSNVSAIQDDDQIVEEVDQDLVCHRVGQGVEHLVNQRHPLRQLAGLETDPVAFSTSSGVALA